MARDTVTETGTAKSERRLPRWSLQRTFTALRYRNYRLWFMGQLSSLIGTWMQTTAQGFLIYQLTNSPAYLGLVGFASGVPSLLFMMYGGVIADRLPRRNLLLVTQGSMMILAFILTTLTFTESVQPWHIIVLSLLLGTANAFDTPARQSFVSELVEREDLGNAIALNSTMFQGAMVVGPAVAGITYALLGPALCFAINGISFLAVLTALLMMRVKATVAPVRVTSAWQDLREGIRYIIAHPIIRTIIALVSLTSIFGMGFNVLFPDWAVVVLGGDATTNGWLQSARGVGSLSGALMIASFGRFKFKGKLLTIGSLVFPFALILFAQVRALPLSLLTLTLVGWSYMSLFNMGNVLIQTHVEDELRGRVMSVYALAFGGLMPLGALLAGTVADQVGSPTAIVAGALITLALAVLVYWQVPNLRALE
ncbi:Putative bacilysin exporter BacE [Anaerolineae bacterium]|nr:Putative bacilysin exporter BacE [Anaerolineae bacterium]